jgi:hypothetical protein
MDSASPSRFLGQKGKVVDNGSCGIGSLLGGWMCGQIHVWTVELMEFSLRERVPGSVCVITVKNPVPVPNETWSR